VPTSVATTRGIPLEFSLQQNYPNPFNPATVLRYALPVQTHVSLTVYNAIGQNVATLVNGELAAGEHEARFDGTGFASGLYFYRLQAGSFVATKKMMLVK
jgi:Secretion system C-terminal sorting domain